ncbi:hypothetical protein D3C77_541690 [compost metagenome]
MAAKVSVSVPIWLILMRIELATPFWMPSRRILVLVTNRSSPTSCTFLPNWSVKSFQPSQSFSAMPSSMEMIGYLSHHVASRLVNSCEDSEMPPSPASVYLPSR